MSARWRKPCASRPVTYNNIPGFIAKFKILENGLELIKANENFMRLFARPDYLLENLAHDTSTAELADKHAAMRRGEPVTFVTQARGNDGSNIWLQVPANAWTGGDDPVYLFVYIDVSELLEQRELQKKPACNWSSLPLWNPVTGGRNRTSFNIDGGGAIRSALPGTIRSGLAGYPEVQGD